MLNTILLTRPACDRIFPGLTGPLALREPFAMIVFPSALGAIVLVQEEVGAETFAKISMYLAGRKGS